MDAGHEGGGVEDDELLVELVDVEDVLVEVLVEDVLVEVLVEVLVDEVLVDVLVEEVLVDVLVVLVDVELVDVELVEVVDVLVDVLVVVVPQSHVGGQGSTGTSKHTHAFCFSLVNSVAEHVSTKGLHNVLSTHAVFTTSSTQPSPSHVYRSFRQQFDPPGAGHGGGVVDVGSQSGHAADIVHPSSRAMLLIVPISTGRAPPSRLS